MKTFVGRKVEYMIKMRARAEKAQLEKLESTAQLKLIKF
jgi:hypothetical protein